jgi:hypothetical protein
LSGFINGLNGMNTSRYTRHGRLAKNRMAPAYWVGGCGLWEASPTKGKINQSVKHYIGDLNVSGLFRPWIRCMDHLNLFLYLGKAGNEGNDI